ncbi:hypothetical protein Ahia01_001240300 [Argonauta hians]
MKSGLVILSCTLVLFCCYECALVGASNVNQNANEDKCGRAKNCFNSVRQQRDQHQTDKLNGKVTASKFCSNVKPDADCFQDNVKFCKEQKNVYSNIWADLEKDIKKECGPLNFGIQIMPSLTTIVLALVAYIF